MTAQLRAVKPFKKQTIIQAEHTQIAPRSGRQPGAYPVPQYWNMSLLSDEHINPLGPEWHSFPLCPAIPRS